MSEYTKKVYGKDLTDQQIVHQVTCYIGQCQCGLLREWYKSGYGKTEEGMIFFELNCQCGACNERD